VGDLFSRPLT